MITSRTWPATYIVVFGEGAGVAPREEPVLSVAVHGHVQFHSTLQLDADEVTLGRRLGLGESRITAIGFRARVGRGSGAAPGGEKTQLNDQHSQTTFGRTYHMWPKFRLGSAPMHEGLEALGRRVLRQRRLWWRQSKRHIRVSLSRGRHLHWCACTHSHRH